MTRQTSIQLTEATDRQVKALTEQGFGTFTDKSYAGVLSQLDLIFPSEDNAALARKITEAVG